MMHAPLKLGLQTPYGETYVTDVDRPKKVINYLNGKALDIRSVIKNPKERIYRVTFDDNRSIIYRESEKVYLGKNIIPFKKIINVVNELMITGTTTSHINFLLEPNSTVHYEPSRLRGHIKPDPYTAGSILVNTDISLPYVNMPGENTNMIKSILDINAWDLLPGDSTDTVYFKSRYDLEDKIIDTPITWEEFMSPFVAGSFISDCGEIPDLYFIAPVEQRWEFIRGLFDSSFNFPSDEFGRPCQFDMRITCNYLNRLKKVASILRSLGLITKVIKINADITRYAIDITTEPVNFIKCFNSVEITRKLVRWIETMEVPKVIGTSIATIECVGETITFGLDLGIKNQIYCDNNFLPRVSV